MRIDGPSDGKVATDSPSRERILTCRPTNSTEEESCARQIASTLAGRAYRGYAIPKDSEILMRFYRDARRDGPFDAGVEAILQRVLSDPKFVYRVESMPASLAPGTAYKVSDLELASRLSFFLWSSIPDDTLLELAQSHQLSRPTVLRQQVERMLADPRASALTANFAGQWLGLRNLAAHTPVVDQFPDFDDNPAPGLPPRGGVVVPESARRESQRSRPPDGGLHVRERAPRGLLRYSWGEGQLLPASKARRQRQCALGPFRQGRRFDDLLATWPNVARDPWQLGLAQRDRRARTRPAANVPALPVKKEDVAGNTHIPTMREQMEEHRRNPACAGCHKMMDPIGFALEPFDAIGHLRTEDRGSPIDASSQMYDGTPVNGPAGVRTFLLKHQDQYLRNVTENLMTYALGRGMDYADMPEVRKVMQSAARDGYRLKALVIAVALSDNFSMNVVPDADPVPAKTGTAAAPAPPASQDRNCRRASTAPAAGPLVGA